jgi:hypothetical protein
MIKFLKTSVVLCAVFVLVLPCSAKATTLGTLDVVHSGFGASDVVTIWGGGFSGVDVWSGVYMLDKSNGYNEGKLWPDGTIGAFCTELSEEAPSTTLTYDVIPLDKGPRPTNFLGDAMGSDKANYIRELWGRFYDSDWASGGSYSWQENIKAAAFATAIWEIVYEDLPTSSKGWDVTIDGTSGSLGFCVDALTDLTDIANVMLHSLDGTGPMADLRVLSYNGAQDYIVEVPEPATLIILGIGGTLGLLRRRRSRA